MEEDRMTSIIIASAGMTARLQNVQVEIEKTLPLVYDASDPGRSTSSFGG